MNAFFKDLQALRQKPIPDLAEAKRRRESYRDYPIDNTNALYCEPPVPLEEFGIEGSNYYYRSDNPPYYASTPGSIDKLLLRSCSVFPIEVDCP